jgi:hypothetical protein
MNTNVCKCYKDPEAADRPYIRYIKIFFTRFGTVLTACVPVFSCVADTGLTLQLRETAGSSSGRVIGEHETISAAYSLLLEECQSRHLLLLYILNVMLLFAFICVIKKMMDCYRG